MSVLTPTRSTVVGPRYKWVVLSNTTIGVLLATLNATSLIIALPVIFRGIHLDPLQPSNFPYLLWIMMGYMLVSAAVVVTVGRIGDMFGRVKMYNLGFAWFTVGGDPACRWSGARARTGPWSWSSCGWSRPSAGRCLMANSAAIITDAFPSEQLGLRPRDEHGRGIVGSFLGILVGGLLSQVGWRWVFLANVPIGAFGTVWAYLKLKEIGVRIKATHRLARATSPSPRGLAMLLIGVTYGIEPYGHSLTGLGEPLRAGDDLRRHGAARRLRLHRDEGEEPMFRLSLFRIRAFTAGNLRPFLGSIGRGGLMFMLMIWFQGIWLPQHGYSFADTPLWAGIYMIPFTLGFVVAGPLSGRLSDRYGARPFATGGMLLAAAMYALMMTFPANFAYVPFAAVMFVSGIGGGLFASPNTASIMNSVPARHRGAASGMRVTFAKHRHAALDGAVLHPAGLRAQRQGARGHVPRPGRPRGPRRQRHPALPPAAARLHLRRLPGLQPAEEPARPGGARPPPAARPPPSPAGPSSPSSSARRSRTRLVAHPRLRGRDERDRSHRLGAAG